MIDTPTSPAVAPVAAIPGRISLPEGARCGLHAAETARFACERCGTFGCGACLFGGEPPPGVMRVQVCRACASEGLSEPIPWERRKELGWWRAFVDTTRLVCLSPERFFRTPSIERGAAGGLFYGVAAYAVGQVLLMVLTGVMIMLGGAVAGAVTEEPVIAGVLAGYGCFFVGMSPLILAQAPVQAMLGIVVAGAAEHGTLVLMKRSKVKFEDTLRVVGYAYAPHVWVFVPVCGGLIAWFWMLWCELKAIRETHRCGTDGALLAVGAFRVLLMLLVLGAYGALIALAFVYAPAPPPPVADFP